MRTRTPPPSRRARAGIVLAATFAALLAVPAGAAAAVPGGRNLTVAHDADFVAAFGYPVGHRLSVEVVRPVPGGEAVVGRAQGPAWDLGATADGMAADGGVEVNHGPVPEDPHDADCFTGTTPDILPGDTVRVTDLDAPAGERPAGVVVPDLTFTHGPKLDERGRMFVEGRAAAADGGALPAGLIAPDPLDPAGGRGLGAELRVLDEPRFRRNTFEHGTLELVTPTTWRGTYTGLAGGDLERAIRPGVEHGVGIDHAPNARESHLASLGAVNGPAPGCEASPSASTAITATSVDGNDRFLNLEDAEGDLEVSGVHQPEVSGVRLRIAGVPGTFSATLEAGGRWRAAVSHEQLDMTTLPEGEVELTAEFDRPAGSPIPARHTIRLHKDTLPPRVVLDPLPGRHRGPIEVTLRAGRDETIFFRDDFLPLAPDGGGRYGGGAIVLDEPGEHQISVRAVDRAGNAAEPVSHLYTIEPLPPPPRPPTAEPAGATAPGPAAGGPAGPPAASGAAGPLRLGSIRMRGRLRLRTARIAGVWASIEVPPGAAVLNLRLLRAGRLVDATTIAARPGRWQFALPRSIRRRRALVPGRYVLEAAPGRSAADLGRTSRRGFRIGR